MSSKIYFRKSGRFNFRRSVVSVASRLHHTIAPQHAVKTARRLFLTPVRGKEVNAMPADMTTKRVATREGQLMTYELGHGPTWVLTHGWSGSASQFFPLMEHIAASGFKALAYDHPAHGKSEGTVSHIPGFVQAFDDLLNHQQDIAGVIAHSMGTAALLESKHPCLKDRPFILVAPVLKYRENLYHTVKASGYSMRLFNHVVSEIGQQYSYPIETVDPFSKLASRTTPAVIVHDRDDRFAPFSVSSEANSLEHVTLIETAGLGHGRILKSDPLKAAFDDIANLTANKSTVN